MEDTLCNACGREMTLKDLETNSFRKVDEKLYCPECLLKIGHPKKMRCPDCGKQTTAVLRDGVYACTHCGREIGGRKESGVIDSAKPSASREPEPEEPVYAGRPRASARKTSRKVRLLTVALGCFIAATLILGALLYRYQTADPGAPATGKDVAPPAPEKEEPKTKDEKAFDLVLDWIKNNPQKEAEAAKLCEDTINDMSDTVLKTRARMTLSELRAKADTAAQRERQEKENLQREVLTLREEVARLKKAAEQAADLPPGPAPVVPPAVPAVPEARPEATEAQTREFKAQTAYNNASDKADKLLLERKYGLAMETFKAVADAWDGTEWGKKAENERQRIRNDAYDEHRKLSERADVLKNQRDYRGARELYARALGFGVPEISQIVQQELASLREEEGAGAEEPAPAPTINTAVRELIQELKSEDEAERSQAASRLGDVGDTEAVSALIEALKDDAWIVRARAAQSLGKLGELRAVPALAEALGDTQEGVIHDALEALKTITGQTFSAADKARWLAWYREAKKKAEAEQGEAALPKTDSFASTIRERRYDLNAVSFVVPKDRKLAVGMKVELLQNNKPFCRVVVEELSNEDNEEQASGTMTDLEPGAQFGPGDAITVRLLE